MSVHRAVDQFDVLLVENNWSEVKPYYLAGGADLPLQKGMQSLALKSHLSSESMCSSL